MKNLLRFDLNRIKSDFFKILYTVLLLSLLLAL